MPKFVVGGKSEPVLAVKLEQDGDDVNILVNDDNIAFFNGSNGMLYLLQPNLEHPGIAINPLTGYIKIA